MIPRTSANFSRHFCNPGAVLRILLVLTLAFSLSGCETFSKWKEDKKKKDEEKKSPLAAMTGDVSLQAFTGRLRQAVAQRDYPMIASMMTPDFGYRWDTPPPNENVFQYWEQNGTWRELDLVLREKFSPSGNYMVAPPQFAADSAYQGYRAGLAMVGGSWKFAYFVPAEPEAPASAPAATPAQ